MLLYTLGILVLKQRSFGLVEIQPGDNNLEGHGILGVCLL